MALLAMNNTDIRKTLRDIAREVFADDALEITDDLSQDDVKAWDSLGHIRLIAATEDAFQITFTMDEIEGLKHMGQLVELVAEKA
jgi:acyl carrier protein